MKWKGFEKTFRIMKSMCRYIRLERMRKNHRRRVKMFEMIMINGMRRRISAR